MPVIANNNSGQQTPLCGISQSVHSLSHVRLFATPWAATCQASLSITNSQSLPKPMSIESVMPSNHLILCHPLLLPSIFPRIRVFSNESVLHIRWPKYWSFSFSISLFIHSLIEGHLGCFQFLTIINNLVISISVQVFVRP